MESEGLGNLFTNSEDRIERSHRILEDHRDVVAANLAHLPVRQGQQVLAIKEDLATDNLSRRRNQSHYGEGCYRFAATRLADKPQQFAAVEIKTHTINCTHESGASGKVGLKISDFQQVWHLELPLCSL